MVYDLLYKIDLNYKLDEKSYGFDQGSDVLYGVIYNSNNSPEMILIDETGGLEEKKYWQQCHKDQRRTLKTQWFLHIAFLLLLVGIFIYNYFECFPMYLHVYKLG